MSQYIDSISVGKIGKNNLSEKYEIISYKGKNDVIIKFLKTDYKLKTSTGNLYTGRVRDRLTPSVYGVGVLGYFRPYDDPYYKKIYSHWAHMIRRCYDKKYKQYKNYGGEGITVCDRWIRFDNFYDDFRKLDGYSEEIMELKLHRHLDKDIKQSHLPFSERVYSLETCCLITREENEKYKREEERPYNKAISPSGTVFYFNNIKKFEKCSKEVIRVKYIHECISGKRENHLGWRFYRVTEGEYNKFHKMNPDTPEFPQIEDIIVIPSPWTKTHYDYVKIYDEEIHKPNYNQKIIK